MKEEALHFQEFMDFYNKEWSDDLVFITSDFTSRFNIDRHLTRYYLFDRMTRKEGLLFRIMYKNKAYYLKKTPENLRRFKRFVWIGVEIEER